MVQLHENAVITDAVLLSPCNTARTIDSVVSEEVYIIDIPENDQNFITIKADDVIAVPTDSSVSEYRM